MLSVEYLRSRLRYDASTGDLIWLPLADAPPQWGAKHANKIAGTLRRDGYTQIRLQRRTFKAHRIVWALNKGTWPSAELDHANGNRRDNRIENLREASRHQNMQNSVAPINKIGIVGVYRNHSGFSASYHANGRRVYLGIFTTAEAAGAAYRKYAAQAHGEFCAERRSELTRPAGQAGTAASPCFVDLKDV